jgi:hypothetical protein
MVSFDLRDWLSYVSDPSVPPDRTLILVVEDEPAVRAVVVKFLEYEGFEVIEAPSADHAVTILQARNNIRIVFTDVTMPGNLIGFDLARIARTLHFGDRYLWGIAIRVRWGRFRCSISAKALPYGRAIGLIREMTKGSSHSE